MRDEEFPAIAFDDQGRILPMSNAEAVARGNALLRAIDGPKVEVVASPWPVPPGYVPPREACGPGPLEVTYLGRRLRVCTNYASPADVAVALDEMFPVFDTNLVPRSDRPATDPLMKVVPVRRHWERDTTSPTEPIEGEGPCPDHPHKRHFIMVAR